MIMNEQMEFLKIGEFEMNLTYPVFRKNGKRIMLTRREFDLMAYFMKSPNMLHTKDSILEDVWGWNTNIETNIINTYVGYLRRKIGYEYFKNVHSFGYKFLPDYREGIK